MSDIFSKSDGSPLPDGSLPENSELSKRLQILSNAFVAITSELDLDKVLQLIADAAREVAGAQYAAIGVVDEHGIIKSFITSGLSKKEREKIGELPRGHGLLGVLIKQGQPLRIPKIADDPRSCGFPSNHPPMDSLLGVPVSIQGRVVGDLYMTNKIAADEFTAEDEWWLRIFARQAAVAIENADLYRRVQQSQQRAQILVELTSQLNRSIDPSVLFNQITQATCKLLGLPAAAIYLLDTGQGHFRFEAQVGMLTSTEEELNLPLQGSVAGQALVENRTIVVEDTAKLSQTFFLHLQNGQLPRGLIVVPIRQGDKITGMLEGYSDNPRRFSLSEIVLMETFTVQAALALEKAQLYRHKEDFLSMTAHDLRAPLTAIKMSSGLLESSLPDNLPPAIGRLASNINRNSIRLDNLIRDLLDLTRLEQGQIQLNLEQVDVKEVLDNALIALTPLFEEKNQVLRRKESSAPYWVNADRHRLEQALVNLLVNANKYTPAEGQITVSLEEDSAANQLSILIQDSGPGIPAAEQPRIFDRYYRQALHEQMPQVAGSGLGLPITRWLVELHGGQLRVESNPSVGPGSCFIIDLPLLNLV